MKAIKKILAGATVMGVPLIAVTVSPAAVIQVPTHYSTIQAAIGIAAAGDVIRVSPGNYCEQIRMKSGVNVEGAGTGVTHLLNPAPTGAANVTFAGVFDARISGFSISGADFTEDCYYWVAGVYIDTSSEVEVSDCLIEDNRSCGVAVYDSEAAVIGNVLTNNGYAPYGFGPAIYTNSSSVQVWENTIVDNNDSGIESSYSTAAESYIGNFLENGGIHIKSGSPLALDNRIVGGSIACTTLNYPVPAPNGAAVIGNVIFNRAALNTGAICVSGNQCEPRVENNIVLGNGVYPAHGIEVQFHAYPEILNNTVALCGNGLFLGSCAAGWKCYNNIFIYNQNGVNDAPGGTNAPDLRFNDVFANWINYSGIAAGATDISKDPLFIFVNQYSILWGIHRNTDFHLVPTSPCIDAGHPGTSYRDPDGSRNDIGAYGGPESEIWGINVLSPPDAPGGLFSPVGVVVHNLSPGGLSAAAELEIRNNSGGVAYQATPSVSVSPAADFTVLPFSIPGFSTGKYDGTARLIDPATGEVMAEDTFVFNVP